MWKNDLNQSGLAEANKVKLDSQKAVAATTSLRTTSASPIDTYANSYILNSEMGD
jgi:hypothetical protein